MLISYNKSKKSQAVIEFVAEFQISKKYSPTLREIMGAVGISSSSVVAYYVKGLRTDGLVLNAKKRARGVELTPEGFVRAGYAIRMCKHCGSISFIKPKAHFISHSRPSSQLVSVN